MVWGTVGIPANSGRHYWEITTDKRSGSGNGYHFMGVASLGAPAKFATGFVGDEAWGLYLSSSKKVHGANNRERYGCEWYNAGNTIGVVLDTDTDGGTLSFIMGADRADQGVCYSQLYTGLAPGTLLFPAMGVGCLEENVYTASFQDCAEPGRQADVI